MEAVKDLENMGTMAKTIKVDNLHELMRANEARHLLEASTLVTQSALYRKESRFGHGHWRGDYPDSSDQWHGSVISKKVGSRYDFRFRKAEVPEAEKQAFKENVGQTYRRVIPRS